MLRSQSNYKDAQYQEKCETILVKLIKDKQDELRADGALGKRIAETIKSEISMLREVRRILTNRALVNLYFKASYSGESLRKFSPEFGTPQEYENIFGEIFEEGE